MTLHQQYVADIVASVKTAMGAVDPTPYFQKYGENRGGNDWAQREQRRENAWEEFVDWDFVAQVEWEAKGEGRS